jgi:hypothetical protein
MSECAGYRNRLQTSYLQDVKSSSPASGTLAFGRHILVFSPLSFLSNTKLYSFYAVSTHQKPKMTLAWTYLCDTDKIIINPVRLHPVADKALDTFQNGHDGEDLAVPGQEGRDAFAVHPGGLSTSVRICSG